MCVAASPFGGGWWGLFFSYFALMKNFLFTSSLFSLFLLGCNNNDQPGSTASENDVDAARNFIRAALDGDYKRAKTFVLDDSTNKQSLDLYENYYNKNMSAEDKKGYKAATIHFLETRQLNDSMTIVQYSNSYKDKKDSLKIIRLNGKWFIDMNFAFQKTDSTSK